MIQCITSKVMFCYVSFKYICMFIDRKYELLDQFYIFHNLNQFMLVDLIARLKVVTSFVIFYNNQINECFCYSKQRKFCDKKIYYKIFLIYNAYTLFTNYELGYLLHVHECIDNFESLLFPYINDFFVSSFYCINVTRSMFRKLIHYNPLYWCGKALYVQCVAYILIIFIVWTCFESIMLKNLLVHLQSL
jgi:hypothetical protein